MSQRWARTIFGVVVVSYIAMLVWLTLSLPERVPMHFDGAGNADDWDAKPAALAFWAGLGLFILGGGALLGRHATGGDGAWLNMPQASKDHWLAPERRAEFRRRMEADVLVLSAWTGLLMVAGMGTTLTASDGRETPGWWFVTGTAVYVVGTIAWTVALLRRYRPPQD